jgi:hypothetical protein
MWRSGDRGEAICRGGPILTGLDVIVEHWNSACRDTIMKLKNACGKRSWLFFPFGLGSDLVP